MYILLSFDIDLWLLPGNALLSEPPFGFLEERIDILLDDLVKEHLGQIVMCFTLELEGDGKVQRATMR